MRYSFSPPICDRARLNITKSLIVSCHQSRTVARILARITRKPLANDASFIARYNFLFITTANYAARARRSWKRRYIFWCQARRAVTCVMTSHQWWQLISCNVTVSLRRSFIPDYVLRNVSITTSALIRLWRRRYLRAFCANSFSPKKWKVIPDVTGHSRIFISPKRSKLTKFFISCAYVTHCQRMSVVLQMILFFLMKKNSSEMSSRRKGDDCIFCSFCDFRYCKSPLLSNDLTLRVICESRTKTVKILIDQNRTESEVKLPCNS